jgi:hypothetical protein
VTLYIPTQFDAVGVALHIPTQFAQMATTTMDSPATTTMGSPFDEIFSVGLEVMAALICVAAYRYYRSASSRKLGSKAQAQAVSKPMPWRPKVRTSRAMSNGDSQDQVVAGTRSPTRTTTHNTFSEPSQRRLLRLTIRLTSAELP